MSVRKIIASALVGAAILVGGIIGTAGAAQVGVNVYGASAQYLFWNAEAPGILAAQGCTNIQQAQKDSKNAITKATCGSDTVYMRVSSKASFDGPSALMGDDHYAASGPDSEKCDAGDPGDPGASLRGYYRKMVDENSCTWGDSSAPGTCTALKCVRVTLGVSDVSAASFNQSSTGQLKGPNGGGVVSRSFSGVPVSGLDHYNPIVVPFAFFVNKSVQRDVDYPNGNFQTITNIPRMMAVMAFSGQAWNWKDFGDDFVDLPVVACLRHAGSGTHATLDYAVMNQHWGASVVTQESASNPTVWFNDGSSDLMKCVDQLAGAIGYSDADQSTSSYSNTVRTTYNGEEPSRQNIRNGRYDFFTHEWAYENPSAPEYAVTHPYVAEMMAYAADGSHIPGKTAWGADKTAYWASSGEMNYTKTDDQHYPAYTGATNPQLP